MPTGRCTYRGSHARLAAALLPLPGLMVPVAAHAEPSVTIAICSAGGERTVKLPERDTPTPRPDDRQACAHVVCPRERADGSVADDEEE